MTDPSPDRTDPQAAPNQGEKIEAHTPLVATAHLPAVGGRIGSELEHFIVEELPLYEASGEGEHLYVFLEKRGATTQDLIQAVARTANVRPQDVGAAGMKDKHAITRQWLSLPATARPPEDWELPEFATLLERSRHRNKLRTGHLRANRFELFVRGAGAEGADEARARLTQLAERGVPAYFGAQRFGRDGANLEAARRWIVEGGRAPRDRFRKKLLVSTLQAALFNELCAERVREGTMDGAIDGDLMRKEETGGLFVCESVEIDRERARRFEISATGPMFGAKMRSPEGEALAREQAALARWNLRPEDLDRFRASGAGTRRPYRVRLTNPRLEVEPDGIRLLFTLPSGAYATVVLAELVRSSA